MTSATPDRPPLSTPARSATGADAAGTRDRASPEARLRTSFRRVPLASVLSVVAGLALWAAVAQSGMVSGILLPRPAEMWHVAVTLLTDGYAGKSFWQSYATSMLRVTAGFGIAVVVGTIIGIAMGRSRLVASLLYPLVETYRPLPALAYYSLLVMILGTGESSKITVLTLGGLPPVILAVRDGAAAVRRERIEGARSLGLSGWQVLVRVIFPSCLPEMLVGARIAFGLSFTTLVAAEMIAATSGLGWMTYQASQYAESGVVIVGLVVMGFTGIAVDILFRRLQAWLVPWVGKA